MGTIEARIRVPFKTYLIRISIPIKESYRAKNWTSLGLADVPAMGTETTEMGIGTAGNQTALAVEGQQCTTEGTSSASFL